MSQLSALPPNTWDNLTAISGDMPRFSFTNSDNVVRVTPRAAAAFVMLRPKGSMHWRKTKPPGWGGFFIVMVQLPFSGNPRNLRQKHRYQQSGISPASLHEPLPPKNP
jgi:hypothetical protein